MSGIKPTFESLNKEFEQLSNKEAVVMIKALSSKYGLQCLSVWQLPAIAGTAPRGNVSHNRERRAKAQPPMSNKTVETKQLEIERSTIVDELKGLSSSDDDSRQELKAALKEKEMQIKASKMIKLLPNVQRSGAPGVPGPL